MYGNVGSDSPSSILFMKEKIHKCICIWKAERASNTAELPVISRTVSEPLIESRITARAAVALPGESIALLLLETLRSSAQDVNNALERHSKYSTHEMQQVGGESYREKPGSLCKGWTAGWLSIWILGLFDESV